MALNECNLTWEAFMACTTHALSTEQEEIMGLLLGNWEEKEGKITLHIWGVQILTRETKQEDRVEVGPEQLSRVAQMAEKISDETGITTRVVGWYHSHPRITVLPSHVDVRTQGQYQAMDERFIGLIFSVFKQKGGERSQVGSIEVTAFQSQDVAQRDGKRNTAPIWAQKQIPLNIISSPSAGFSSALPLSAALENLVLLQDVLFKEERAAYADAARGARRSLLQGAHAGATYQRALCHLLGALTLPLLAALAARRRALAREIEELREANAALRRSRPPPSAGAGAAARRGAADGAASAAAGAAEQPGLRFRALRDARRGVKLTIKSGGESEQGEVRFTLTREVSKAGIAAWILQYGSSRGRLVGVRAADRRQCALAFDLAGGGGGGRPAAAAGGPRPLAGGLRPLARRRGRRPGRGGVGAAPSLASSRGGGGRCTSTEDDERRLQLSSMYNGNNS